MRGRKPKPTALKRLEGNPGKRKLRPEPAISAEMVECPAHLSKAARAEWARVYAELHRAGVIRMTDRAALSAYCQAWGDWVDARGYLAKVTPKQLQTEDGLARWKAFLRMGNVAQDQMRRWAVELGMTPSARARVKVEPQQQEQSLAELLFAGVKVDDGAAG